MHAVGEMPGQMMARKRTKQPDVIDDRGRAILAALDRKAAAYVRQNFPRDQQNPAMLKFVRSLLYLGAVVVLELDEELGPGESTTS